MNPEALGLPHREPFVFVDALTAREPGVSATCRTVFQPERDFFRGHFPGDPLVPGVILTEALAQTAGLAVGEPGVSFRLAAIKGMKFLAAVRPGEEVVLHARKLGAVGSVWQFEVTARVAGRVVAEGAIVLSAAS